MFEEFIWSQKYRPNTLEDCILPPRLLDPIRASISKGSLMNSIYTGPAGVGKTTAAIAACKDLKADWILLEGSGADRNIDTVRTKVLDFATKMSMEADGRKFIIYDEADNLTADAQLALRTTIELVSRNCGFILTCNYHSKLIDPLKSRCEVIDFRPSKEERNTLMKEFIKRAVKILKTEGIKIESVDPVVTIVKKHFPDYRRVLNALQKASQGGELSVASVHATAGDPVAEVVKLLREKEFLSMRKWVAQASISIDDLISELNTRAEEFFKKEQLPQVGLDLYDAMKFVPFCSDLSLAMTALLTNLMSGDKIKS